ESPATFVAGNPLLHSFYTEGTLARSAPERNRLRFRRFCQAFYGCVGIVEDGVLVDGVGCSSAGAAGAMGAGAAFGGIGSLLGVLDCVGDVPEVPSCCEHAASVIPKANTSAA